MIVNTKQRWSGVKKHAMRAVKTQTPHRPEGSPHVCEQAFCGQRVRIDDGLS